FIVIGSEATIGMQSWNRSVIVICVVTTPVGGTGASGPPAPSVFPRPSFLASPPLLPSLGPPLDPPSVVPPLLLVLLSLGARFCELAPPQAANTDAVTTEKRALRI